MFTMLHVTVLTLACCLCSAVSPQEEDDKHSITEMYDVRSDTTLKNVAIHCTVGTTCIKLGRGVSLTMSHVTVTSTGEGRLLYMSQGSNLQMDNVDITGFQLNGEEDEGAVVLAVEGNHHISILNSDISYNKAGGLGLGGSVLRANDSRVEILDSNFNNNTAAIAAIRSTMDIKRCNFTSNTGAVAVAWGKLTLTNSVFSGNAVSRSGGALGIMDSNVTIDNSSFLRNEAETGGAIWVGMDSGVLNITRSTFIGNKASFEGNAIRCYRKPDAKRDIIINISYPPNFDDTKIPESDIGNDADDCKITTY